ncbi:MAG: hypothetical protein UFG06_07295 [Lachnospiraceae bacterium]|nr:hypothetical protein [Lachnospiraceae bacterium]
MCLKKGKISRLLVICLGSLVVGFGAMAAGCGHRNTAAEAAKEKNQTGLVTSVMNMVWEKQVYLQKQVSDDFISSLPVRTLFTEQQTYWTLTVEDYEVSLKDLVPGMALKLVIKRAGEDEIIARTYYREKDYKEPSEFTAGTFENLLGHDGFYLYDHYFNMWYLAYYYALEGDELICLADSWGGDPSDYMVDLDGDGDRELVCNVVYTGDGACRTIIYRYDGKQVEYGWGRDFLDEPYDDYGVPSTGNWYLPEENVINIWFYKDEMGDYDSKNYEIDLSKITMYPYQSEK